MNRDAKKIFSIASLSVLFLTILVYAFFSSRSLIFGVKIKNVNITDGAKVEKNILEIKGNAKNAINITLNGREISINQQGDFDETIILLSGYNVIDIKAKDKFGKEDEKIFRLIGEFAK
ncbi:hypothetical protein K8Q94_01930 [Candidatus Nomurabacteria bacterium]|nr:hypothetical protein [Candidatus Nomurabacteria bacterium]